MESGAVLMEHMSIFAEQRKVRDLLREYLRRVILERPVDPVSFLLEEIRDRPYLPTKTDLDLDNRSPAEQTMHLDLRSVETKTKLLSDLFYLYADPEGRVDRGHILVAFADDPAVLLTRFPRHAIDIPKAIEHIDSTDGFIDWPRFAKACLSALSVPGSSS